MKKIIYVRMPRCGSTSIAQMCKRIGQPVYGGGDMGFWKSPHLWPGLSDEERRVPTNSNPRLPVCISEHVGTEEYDSSLTFSTVRNPYSRAVSAWQHPTWFPVAPKFEDFCRLIAADNYHSLDSMWHACSTYYHLFDADGNQLVKHICKLENIQQDVDTMFDAENLPKHKIPRQNVGTRRQHKVPLDITSKHYTEWYTTELKDIISKKYEKDIEEFEYAFGE